jgi:hypothetical protein
LLWGPVLSRGNINSLPATFNNKLSASLAICWFLAPENKIINVECSNEWVNV